MSKRSLPKYGFHKATGQARVRLNGKDYWLGKYDTKESRKRYAELLLEWEQATDIAPSNVTFRQLSVMYNAHAQKHYVKNGKQTSEVGLIVYSLRYMNRVCKKVLLKDVKPRHMKEARRLMIENGLTRGTCNKFTQRIRRSIRWAVSEELCDSSVLVGLQAVDDLKRGRTEAQDNAPVKPVSEAYVNGIEGDINSVHWGAIQFQLTTGARPSEALLLRGCDLDMSGPVWTYTPESHKTQHHGKSRVICIGPQGQKVLRQHLTTDLTAYVFGTLRSKGKTPYRRDSYTTAIRRACLSAGVPVWGPNRLRHNFATKARKEFGIEAARVTLGHSSAVTSEIYAERDVAASMAIVAKIG